MTPNDSFSQNNTRLDEARVDKILDHNAMQLSALIDGELAPDEARFLLRRLQHDAELGDCWEHWQIVGEVLRGRAEVLMPAEFASRVAASLAAERGLPSIASSRPRWLRWGGGAALAASVAVVALFVARQSPNANTPIAPAQVIAVTTPGPAPDPTLPAPTRPLPVRPAQTVAAQLPAPTTPDPRAAQLVAAVAVAAVPRRIASRRSRGQSQRAALRAPAGAIAQAPVMASASTNALAAGGASAQLNTAVDPFAARGVNLLPNRPWPRALLPGAPASGAFTVDYDNRSAPSPSFYPFEPHMPATQTQEDSSKP